MLHFLAASKTLFKTNEREFLLSHSFFSLFDSISIDDTFCSNIETKSNGKLMAIAGRKSNKYIEYYQEKKQSEKFSNIYIFYSDLVWQMQLMIF